MTDVVRVRFAPSPTGALHLGSARSALYNWLVARHLGAHGIYVLRIEDTDVERSTPEHVQQALSMFRWLGLDWDEGPEVGGPFAPYFQSERLGRYQEVLTQLLDSGQAYRCDCTKQQLDAERASAEAERRAFVYSGRCRDRSDIEVDMPHVIRFRCPDTGTTIVNDLVLGETPFENSLIGDFVVARADGTPLYNFANVVDDSDMQITHVIRGNDHLSNTPKQILMYEALGLTIPAFAHLPMVLGPDGAKLSKRRHHTSTIEQLAQSGYAAEAVRNAIALVGWSKDAETEIMATSELIESFDISRVKKSPARIDYDKLAHINGAHLRAMTIDNWAQGYETWREQWLLDDAPDYAAAFALDGTDAAKLVQEKCDTWGEVPSYLRFMLDPFTISPEAWERLHKTGDVGMLVLAHIHEQLSLLEVFDAESLEHTLRGACDALELKAGKVFAPIRVAVTGQTVAPGLWESIEMLGKQRALDRIGQAQDRLARALANA